MIKVGRLAKNLCKDSAEEEDDGGVVEPVGET